MAMCIAGAVGTVILGVYVVLAIRDLPSLPRMPMSKTTGIEVYDRQNRLIGVIGQRTVDTYEDIPLTFIQALLATEDRGYFEHQGVSLRGALRAALANLTSADMTRQGGSTITMQTVRLITEDRSPSLSRKIREMALAYHLERALSKKEILMLYASICYLGEGQYGIEAASRHYFGIPSSELSPAQAATLVAMLKAPSSYSRRYPDRLRQRRDLILRLMNDQGYLDTAQLHAATAQNMAWSQPFGEHTGEAFFLDFIAAELRNTFGARFLSMCSRVYTTLDLDAQQAALEAVERALPGVDEKLGSPAYSESSFNDRQFYPQTAMVALNVADNSILAWIGGRDYAAAPFNALGGRGVARRQPGSAFKTFAYALAMEQGIRPETVLVDAPITLEDPQRNLWSPGNYDGKYYGPMILKQMMVKSLNSMAVRLINEHGVLNPAQLAAFASRCGIETPLPPHPSLPLGSVEITPLELASAYSVFARDGIRIDTPYAIREVYDHEGQLLFAVSRSHNLPRVVLDPVSCYYTIDALKAVVDHGTAWQVGSMVPGVEVAGKTGTSGDYRDAWFVGLTPQVICAAWVGFDDNRSMVHPEIPDRVVVGGNSAAVIIGRFLQSYPQALGGHFWAPPEDAVIRFAVDPKTGEPDALNPDAVMVPYVLRSYMTTDITPLVSEENTP